MISKRFFFSIILFLVFSNLNSYAQFIEDALRFIKPNAPVSPRASALGESFLGFSDDAACLTLNPAGLTLIPSSELAIGVN